MGAIAAPMQQLAGLMQALPRNLAYGVSALLDQQGGAPVVEPPPVDEPAAAAEPDVQAEAEAGVETAAGAEPATEAEVPADQG